MTELVAWMAEHGYPLIFAVLLASGFGLPVPEDVPLVTAGVLAAHGGMTVTQASLACGGFVLARDFLVFTIGARYGEALLRRPFVRRRLPERIIGPARERVRRNGAFAVVVGRFLPGLRVAVFFVAGTSGVSPGRFLLADGLAALVSVPLFVWAGWFAADNYDQLQELVVRFRALFAAVVVLAVAGWLLRRRLLRSREAR